MKKIIILTVIVLSTFVISSCDDWLEVLPPQDLVQNEYWKTKEDVEAVLMAAYKQCASLDEAWFMGGEIRADMVEVVKTTNYLKVGDGKLLPDNSLCNWANYYKAINYCNYILDFAASVQDEDPTFNDYQLAGFESEAYFIRSYVYFFLVRMYGDVPFVTQSAKTDNQNFYLPATNQDTLLSYITSDLLKARLNVPDEYGDLINNKGRASKAACDALLADIYLWREDYENCIKHCNYIDSTRYLLLPGDLWFENFYPGNSLESIMEFQLGSSNGIGNNLYGQTRSAVGIYTPSASAYEIFFSEETIEVLRTAGSISTNTKSIWKYVGMLPDNKSTRGSSDQTAANWILYRMADVLLMKAEALVQLDRYSEALDIVNLTRERVFLPKIPDLSYGKKATEDIVLDERARELAFEGKRWWDLMRMGRRNNYERKDDFIKIITENLPITQKLVLTNRLLDPNGWYWPIYNDELERNKNLEQNPFYAPYSDERN